MFGQHRWGRCFERFGDGDGALPVPPICPASRTRSPLGSERHRANGTSTVSLERTERTEPDPETVRRRIRRRGYEIRERELDEVFATLEAQGELTDERRTIIRQTATTIVDELLTPAETTVARASVNDRAVLATTVELFDPDRR